MTDTAVAVLLLLDHLTDDRPATPAVHHRAVDRCYTAIGDAREHARRMLASLEGRPPHRVEVEAAVVVCPWGTACSSQITPLRRTA